jgi:hypothetical protein
MTTRRKPKVVALYREGTKAQAATRQTGIEAQQASVARAAILHGLDVIAEIGLAGVPRNKVGISREYGEMLGMIQGGEIEGVVVSGLDRIVYARTPDEMGEVDHLVQAQATIYTESHAFDLSTRERILCALTNLILLRNYWHTLALRSAIAKAGKRRNRMGYARRKCPGKGELHPLISGCLPVNELPHL